MNTRKPISTISYNTRPFLEKILSALVDENILDFACFVQHFGEDDECGKKDHFHIYAEPARQVDTKELESYFAEPDQDYLQYKLDCERQGIKPKMPIKVLKFQSSKFDDWYMYSMHEDHYLKAKGLEKKYHYKDTDFWGTCEGTLNYKARMIDRVRITPMDMLMDAVIADVPFDSLVAMGRIPIAQLRNYEVAYYAIKKRRYQTDSFKESYYEFNDDDEMKSMTADDLKNYLEDKHSI